MRSEEGWGDGLHAVARVFVIAALLASTACATRVAGVEQRMIVPAGTARHEMAANQAFVYPQAQANAAPAFPAGYERAELAPTTLCAKFVVGTDGAVRDVALLDDSGCSSPGEQPQLGAAVLGAVSAWRYEPAAFCDYPDAATRDRDWNGVGCAGALVETRPVAVTLAYAFTFEVRNGRQRVGTAQRRE